MSKWGEILIYLELENICKTYLNSENHGALAYLETDEESIYFRCENGETISSLGRCDGTVDCHHGDDEMGCEEKFGV